MFRHATGPRERPAEEGLLKQSILAVGQKNNFQPQALDIPQEEAITISPGTTGIKEGQPHVEVVGEERCNKMDTEYPAKQKGPPLVPGEGRNSNHRRKRAAGKYRKLYLLCWVAFILRVSDGVPVGAQPAADQKLKCFTCMGKDGCTKLMNIYDPDHDTHLYHRELNETFPVCSVIPPPGPKLCAVCRGQSNITISCSEDVGQRIDVEDSNGGHLDISPLHCVQQQTPGRTHFVLIPSVAVLLIVAGALVYSWRKRGHVQSVLRIESAQQ